MDRKREIPSKPIMEKEDDQRQQCHFFQLGQCRRSARACNFKHSPNPPQGYCDQGRNCHVRHNRLECPIFEKTLDCKNETCEYHHNWSLKFADSNRKELESVFSEMKADAKFLNDHLSKKRNAQGSLTVDIMFIMDCTGSMGSWIEASKREILNIVDEVQNSYEEAVIKMSFVAYRDFCDGDLQYANIDFTEDIVKVKTFIENQIAYGGGDCPEDVAGGLELALNQSWSSKVKYAIFIADAPGHGKQYHTNDNDDYPRGDPRGRNIEKLIEKFAQKHIELYAVKITSQTDKMYDIMSKAYKAYTKNDIKIIELGASTELFGFLVASSVTQTISKTFGTGVSKNYTMELLDSLKRSKLTNNKNTENQMMEIESQGPLTQNLSSSVNYTPMTLEEPRDVWATDSIIISKEIKQEKPIKTEPLELSFDEGVKIPAIKVRKRPPGDWLKISKKVLPAIARTWFIVKDKNINIDWRKPFVQSSQITTKVSIAFEAFSEGAMRYAHYMRDIDMEENMVAKLPKKIIKENYNPENMMKDIESMIISQHIVNEFNDKIISKLGDTETLFSFVGSYIYEITDETFPYKYWWAENYMDGVYEKFNNNDGWVNKRALGNAFLANTFSHYSWQLTRGYLMIVDIQGVKGVLTDPQIHCLDKARFGEGNLGYYGMMSFFLNHSCNKYCNQLNLVHPIKDKEIPKEFKFFIDKVERPVIEDEILNKLCDLCRKHFPLKAITYYYQKLDYPEMYCKNCEIAMKKTMKEGTCVDCKSPFRSSEFWFKMKRTDFPVRCSPCRLLLRNKMRKSL